MSRISGGPSRSSASRGWCSTIANAMPCRSTDSLASRAGNAPKRVVSETGGQQCEGPVQLGEQVHVVVADPVKVSGHRGTQRRARDDLREVVTYVAAKAPRHELGDHVAPVAVAHERMANQGGDRRD